MNTKAPTVTKVKSGTENQNAQIQQISHLKTFVGVPDIQNALHVHQKN